MTTRFQGFFTLFHRESLRFLSLPNQTLLPSVVNVVLYLIVFGHFIGSHVSEIDGFPFVVYIFPGLIMMGATQSAYQNSATSLFISRWEHFIDDLLVAPIPFIHMVCAYAIAATLRGALVGIFCLIGGWFFVDAQIVHPFHFLVAVIASSFCFGSVGIINGLFAKRWDHIAVLQNYIITPLVFLGGVFYSTHSMPERMQWINHINPLFYMVSSIRYAYLGRADISFALGLSVTVALGAAFFIASVEFFRRGYNLRS